jgi:hypothetical protein
MAYLMTIDDIIADIQQYLDTDHRYFDQDEGVIDFGSERIAYVRLPDEFKLTVDGATLFVPRP